MNKAVERFTKKPVTIEAFQWDGKDPDKNYTKWPAWAWESRDITYVLELDGIPFLEIETLEGFIHASPKDWIIKGIKGEIYPCKPDIFEATYEPEHPPTAGNEADLTDNDTQQALEGKHILIANSYKEAQTHICNNHWVINDYFIITPKNKEKIMGLELSEGGYSVIGDPLMPYSFWTTLLSRIRKQ